MMANRKYRHGLDKTKLDRIKQELEELRSQLEGAGDLEKAFSDFDKLLENAYAFADEYTEAIIPPIPESSQDLDLLEMLWDDESDYDPDWEKFLIDDFYDEESPGDETNTLPTDNQPQQAGFLNAKERLIRTLRPRTHQLLRSSFLPLRFLAPSRLCVFASI